MKTDRILVVGILDKRQRDIKEFPKIEGVSVSQAYIVYSPQGICPTQCAAHFQSLILVSDEETDSDHNQ